VLPKQESFSDIVRSRRLMSAFTLIRGPNAARMYKEARQEAIRSGKLKANEKDQVVSVLKDGFANFGSKYKVRLLPFVVNCPWLLLKSSALPATPQSDPALVEKYDEESWKYR
jgi:hypothetical protein